MSIEIAPGTPLAEALKNVIQPQLAEAGWATGGLDDLALAEYIILMLVNGKTQQEVASEMATDFLDLSPDDEGAINFSRWLFDQVDILNRQLNGGPHAEAGVNGADSARSGQTASNDAEMGDAADVEGGSIPTGPKAMRNGSGNGAQKPRDKRMLGQLHKAMDRSSDSALHRVRNSSGTGRVSSHPSRDPPRGPRNQQLGRGIAAMANGRGMGGMGPMGGMNGMPGMPMQQMGPNGPITPVMTPQQQMALLQMYEQQAQMMQQLFSNQPVPNAFVNPNFPGNNPQVGKSLFERVDNKSARFNKHQQHHNKSTKREPQDETMTDGADSGASGEPKDPTQTRCRFDLSCTKADCSFVHQSPAAPPGTSIDMNDTCSFGAACMNKKCVGKHPSPAQRESHKGETDCVFYPNCRDQQNCPYRHPDMPPCRNGADCTVPNCKFAHNKVMCRFTPCTKSGCPFKHVEGQKKSFADMQWTANRNGSNEENGIKKEHVSERKFVDDETAEEELILPGKSSQDEMETQIIT